MYLHCENNVIFDQSKYDKERCLIVRRKSILVSIFSIIRLSRYVLLLLKCNHKLEQSHTVGLKSDGTVVAVGRNEDDQCDVSDWSDIVAVSAGGYHTVGLKSDGTVIAVGNNDCGQCDVSDWSGLKTKKE